MKELILLASVEEQKFLKEQRRADRVTVLGLGLGFVVLSTSVLMLITICAGIAPMVNFILGV